MSGRSYRDYASFLRDAIGNWQFFNIYSSTQRSSRLGDVVCWRPPTDFYETDDAFIVCVEVSGLSEGDFSMSVSGRTLRIEGQRKESVKKVGYYQMEIAYGTFSTEIEIPGNVQLNLNRLETVYQNGFLFVQMPKLTKQCINNN